MRIALGLLLLTAAGLKLAGRDVSPVPQVGWFSMPTIQVAAAEWEIVLGIWLLSGAYQLGAWFASIATFLTFAVVSGFFGWRGVASCGCFGSMVTSPWFAFAIDVLALCALLLLSATGALGEARRQRIPVAEVLKTGLTALTILVVVATISMAVFWNPEDIIAGLRGESLTITPVVTDVGSGTVGEKRTFEIRLRNHSDKPIRVVGGTSSCACTTIEDMPLLISPHDSRVIKVTMVFRGQTGDFQYRFLLYSDDALQPFAAAWFNGEVVGLRDP